MLANPAFLMQLNHALWSAIPNAERRQDFVSRLSEEGPGELGISSRELVSQFDPENPMDLQAVGVNRVVGRAARDVLLRQFSAPPPHSCSCCSPPFSSHYPSQCSSPRRCSSCSPPFSSHCPSQCSFF
uniref:Uncharacterized protein n=1 Tax=Chromera velia CCMP2878 TaxID=1169474 RepID=A0A0G4F4X1_9ALVE|eukprot:Cvel_15254.t1-p1 / transcript=Cvel_15254.t1 / gene=Cvel_15254 / organism=Chromera_velia_CCMP2878 / gene_product=hypothetical protein / transcript_product=hypothetical protein / location=Cvel_scaffold1117:52929-53309(+) / protein_length=127 / sequence_SO=supercontig / SO=protein_coding / is_pseudo=false